MGEKELLTMAGNKKLTDEQLKDFDFFSNQLCAQVNLMHSQFYALFSMLRHMGINDSMVEGKILDEIKKLIVFIYKLSNALHE